MKPVVVPVRREYDSDAYENDLEKVRHEMREEYKDEKKQVPSPLEAACWKQIQNRDSEEEKWKRVHASSSGRWAKARASFRTPLPARSLRLAPARGNDGQSAQEGVALA